MAPPKLQPALLGGLLAGVLSVLPFVNLANCCCLWVLAGGVMAAYLMQLNYALPITIGEGATVGFLAGIFGGLLTIVLDIPMQLYLLPLLPQMGTLQTRRSELPPEVRDAMRHLGPRVIVVAASILFFTIGVIFSTIGGLFGAIVFRKPAPPPAGPPPGSSHPPVIPPAGPPVEAWSYPDQDQSS
jgi:hypothetical protein